MSIILSCMSHLLRMDTTLCSHTPQCTYIVAQCESMWRVPALGEPRSHVFTVTLIKRSPRGPNPSCNCPNLEYGTGGDQRSPVDAHNGRHGARGALHAGHQHKPRPVEQREVERERLSTPPHAAQAATCCSAASKALRSSVLQPPGERNRWVLVDYGWICSHDARDSSAEQSAHVS